MNENHRRLGINIDHVATLRQARLTDYPCPIKAARICVEAGADLITAHLREDARHIQEHDLTRLLAEDFCRVNLEISATPAMTALACRHRPQDCCLVPEKREELTTEGGLNMHDLRIRLEPLVGQLHDAGIKVSLFIEPELRALETAAELGVKAVELHTGAYANAADFGAELERLRRAAEHGERLGLQVNAGHGLTLDNLDPVAQILNLAEFNIGHYVVSQALFDGLGSVVARLKQALLQPFTTSESP